MANRTDDVLTRVMDAYVAATPPPPEFPTRQRRPVPVRRPVLVLAGAFAAVVAIGAVLAVVASFGGADQPVTGTTEGLVETVTTVAESTPAPAKSVLSEFEWTVVVSDPARDLSFGSVVSDGSRLVAGGQIGASEAMGTPNMATIWYSDDEGTTWNEVTNPSFEPPAWRDGAIDATSTIARIADIAVVPEGFVAVGALDDDAAVWVSPDGQRWDRVEDEDLGGQGLQAISDIETAGGAMLATGYSDSGPHAWASQDGRDWVQVDLFATFPWPTAISHDTGFTVFAPIGDNEEGLWTSPDGLKWDHQGLTDVEPELVAQNPADGSFTAIGTGGVWTSADGVTWTKVHSNTQPDYANSLNPIRPDSGTLIWHEDWLIATDPDTGIWSSIDGIAWTRFEWSSDGPDRTELASINGQLIAFGDAIWIGTASQE